MKLRYQLRGLGIGIVVTALLMGAASKEGAPMSDAEIKAKALALGMVESDSLRLSDLGNADLTSEPPADASAKPAGTDGSGGGTKPAETSAPGDNANPAHTSAPGDEAGPAGTSAPNSNPSNSGAAPTDIPAGNSGGHTQASPVPDRRVPEDGENITVVIESGEIASEISRKMAEAGLVEDAAAFEKYLCEIGCTRSIWDGTYTIPAGTSMEDIARIIAKLE